MNPANSPSFPDFGKLVPGFDFLQNLAKQAAGSAAHAMPQLPNLANWIAPTINVEELDKRVQELKAVQFWLDQNAAALKATIQALEVQKMTLATLKGMNFSMGDVANAFKLKVGDSLAGGAQRGADKAKGFAGLEVPPSAYQASKEKAESGAQGDGEKPSAPAPAAEAPAPATGIADPMQWWSALTQQFQTIAAEAMKEVARTTTTLDSTKSMAKDAVKTATDMATGMARNMAETATKTMAGGAWPQAVAAGTKDTPAAKPRKAPAKTAAAKTTAAKSPAAKPATKAPARKAAGAAARKTPR